MMLGSECSACCEPSEAFCFLPNNTNALITPTRSDRGFVWNFKVGGTLDLRSVETAPGVYATEVYLDCRDGLPEYQPQFGFSSSGTGSGHGGGLLIVPKGEQATLTISGSLPKYSGYFVTVARCVSKEQTGDYDCGPSGIETPALANLMIFRRSVRWIAGRPNGLAPLHWPYSSVDSGAFCEAVKGAIVCEPGGCRINNPQSQGFGPGGVSLSLRECSPIEDFTQTKTFVFSTKYCILDVVWHRFSVAFSPRHEITMSLTW